MGTCPLCRAVTGKVAAAATSQTTDRVATVSEFMVLPKASEAPAGEGGFIARRWAGPPRHEQRSPLGLYSAMQTAQMGINPSSWWVRANRVTVTPFPPRRTPNGIVRRLGTVKLTHNNTICESLSITSPLPWPSMRASVVGAAAEGLMSLAPPQRVASPTVSNHGPSARAICAPWSEVMRTSPRWSRG